MTTRPIDPDRVAAYADSLRAWADKITPEDITPAVRWYADAREIAVTVADRLGVSVECGAVIVAAFSPRCPWARNIALAVDYASGREVRTIGAHIRAADRAVSLDRSGADPYDALGGPKTSAFARNIAGDLDPVTVDVWHLRAAGVTDRDAPTVVQYREITAATRLVAEEYGYAPAVLQAIVWTAIRGGAS